MDPFEIYAQIWKISDKMKARYDEFWRRIYYDDSYVFYKNAFLFYKNIQNGKYHDFFGGIVNRAVYENHCKILGNNVKQEFVSDDRSLTPPSSDSLCDLSYHIINLLDLAFGVCPRVPYDLIVHRYELRFPDDELFDLKKGDFYHNQGFMSTTLNPWYPFGKLFVMMPREKVYISLTILVPKYIKGCYINTPFNVSLEKNLYSGFEEFELLLPRDCIFEILSAKKSGNVFMIEMILRYQIHPADNPPFSGISKSILDKKEVEHLQLDTTDPKNYDPKLRNVRSTLLSLYQSYPQLPIPMADAFYSSYMIKHNEISQWSKRDPKYKNINSSKQDVDYFRNVYLDNLPNMITLENSTIYMTTDWSFQLWFTKEIYHKLNKSDSIKINYSLMFDLELDASAYAYPFYYIYQTDNTEKSIHDKYFTIDESYPLFIITKLKVTKLNYIPMGVERGFTIDVRKIKILKYQKRFLSGDHFFLTVECEAI